MSDGRRPASSFGAPKAGEPQESADIPAQLAPPLHMNGEPPGEPTKKERRGLRSLRKRPNALEETIVEPAEPPSNRAEPAAVAEPPPVRRRASSFGPPGAAELEAIRASTPRLEPGTFEPLPAEAAAVEPAPLAPGPGPLAPEPEAPAGDSSATLREAIWDRATVEPGAALAPAPPEAAAPTTRKERKAARKAEKAAAAVPSPPPPDSPAPPPPLQPMGDETPAYSGLGDPLPRRRRPSSLEIPAAPAATVEPVASASPAATEPAAELPGSAESWSPIVTTNWPPPPDEPAVAADGAPPAFRPAPIQGVVAAAVIDAIKIYGYDETAVYALAGISVSFAKGHFTAIMGPSGSGKSTLMHCLAGLDRLTKGQVLIGDTDLSTLSDRALTQLRRDKVGFIFQQYNLVPTLTAIENITLPLDLAGTRPDAAWLNNVVDTLRIRDRLKHKPDELSGGQQQRVAVARALATRPQIIFADEPTGNLDTRAGAEVLRIMKDSVRELGQTVVMVTHDPVAAGYADRAIFLMDGRVVSEMFAPTAERVLDEMKTLGG